MQTYKEIVAKFREKNSKKPKTPWRYESWADSYEQGGRVGYKPGGIVEPGVTHYAKEDFIRNPSGINQYTKKMKSLDEIKATIDKFPEWTAKDFLGEGTFNKKGIVLSRTELERAKEAGIEPHVKGKRTIKGTGARNLKRRIITKARSSESMEVALAALRKSGLQFSHLALDEPTSLQNTGYLPKDINIKGYHKFEKKVVDIAKQIKETQNNKKFSIPERRNKIAKLQKEDRALRKQFPEYAKTKARLVTKATSLDPSGIMIKEKLLDPKIAISQESGTQLKGVTPKSEKGKEIIKMSKKSITNILTKADIKCNLANGINCNDPRAYIKSINELKAKAALGDKAALGKFRKVANAMRKFKGPLAFTGWGILGEIGFALPFAAMNYADGQSTARIINEASFGLFGMNEEEEAISYLPKDSLGGAIPSAMRAGERIEKLEDPSRVFPKGRMGMDENRFKKAQAKVAADAKLDLVKKVTPFMEGPRNEYLNEEAFAKAYGELEEAKAKQAADIAKRKEDPDDPIFDYYDSYLPDDMDY